MTITVTASGISLDGPLVAGEVVAVSVSGVTFAEDAKPTLCLLGRFPDALLSSVELTEDENTPGTWTGQLDTATKQTAVFFATARADECRDAVLELVAARQSVARLMVAFRNSALCPSPFHAPDASPVYVPVPGPPGQGGDPYDQNPAMDGVASAGVSDKYARGDHTHPTDSSRASAADVTAIQNVIPSTATPSNKLATAADIPAAPPSASTATPQMDGTGAAGTATTYARGDHQHPSDTAKVSKSGDTMTGGLVVSADGFEERIGPIGMSVGAGSDSVSVLADRIVRAKNGASAGIYVPKPDTNLCTLALQEGIAPAFSASSTYAVGDYVTHEGLLYKCTTAVSTAGAWNASDWTAVAVTDEMGADTPLPFDAECEYVTVPAGAYIDPDVAAYDASLGVDVTFRLASDTTLGNGAFRCGFWTNDQTTSFQLYINSQSDLKLIRYYSSIFTVSNSPFIGSFATASIHGTSFSNGTNTTSVGDPGTSLHAPLTFWICAVGDSSNVPAPCINPVDVAAVRFSFSDISLRNLVPVRVGTVGYLYDKVSGRLFGSAVGSIPLVPGPDKATPTITKPDRLVEINERNNYLAYASTTTIDPETAVYRATAALSGTTATMPTVTITGIPTAAAYFAFELEVAVDATATAIDDTAWSGWTWMDGGELPTADYAGKTLYIACRLDCTARTIKANCYEVA
jgi:hypothetical protein